MPTCIVCEAGTSFRSEEHIFPLALGNQEHILPPGVVCDDCNNGPLSVGDNALVSFPGVLLTRTAAGIRNRNGRVLPTRAGPVSMENPTGNHIHLRVPERVTFTPLDDGGMRFSVNMTFDPLSDEDHRRVARGLLKQAFEFMYLDLGVERALAPELSPLRRVLEGKAEFHGYLSYGFLGPVRNRCVLTYQVDGPSLQAVGYYAGVVLITAFPAQRPRSFGGTVAGQPVPFHPITVEF